MRCIDLRLLCIDIADRRDGVTVGKGMATTAPVRKTRKTRIVCIADTHNQTPKLPQGDVLIHAGDLTKQGNRHELQKNVAWLEAADFEAKIVVAGTLGRGLIERRECL